MARYLIDVNLPRYFSIWSGEEFAFVADLDAKWTDTQIWQYASASLSTIVTKDADFSDRVLLSDGGPHVIHLRVGNMRMRDFHVLLSSVWKQVCSLSEKNRLVQVYPDRIECIE